MSEDPLITLQREGKRLAIPAALIFGAMAVTNVDSTFNSQDAMADNQRVVELQRPLTDRTMRKAFRMMQRGDATITETNLTASQKYELNQMYRSMKRLEEARREATARGFSDGYSNYDDGWGS